jgi:hypothetical protein
LCRFGRRLEEASKEAGENTTILKKFKFTLVGCGDGKLDRFIGSITAATV